MHWFIKHEKHSKKKTKEFQNNKLNLSMAIRKSSNNKNSKNRNYERNDDKMHCYIRNLGSSIFAVAAAVVAFSQKRAIALNNTMPFAATSNSVPFLIIFAFVLFSFQQSQHTVSVSH